MHLIPPRRYRLFHDPAFYRSVISPPCVGDIGLDEMEAAHRTTGQYQGSLKIVPSDADYEANQRSIPSWRPPLLVVSRKVEAA